MTGTEKAAYNEEYEGKPELVAYIEDGITIDDCLSFCFYHGGSNYTYPVRVKQQPALLSAGMGVEITEERLFEIAKRVKNLERAYDVRLGRTRDIDLLPKRWMDHPIERGDFKGSVLETSKFEQMKSKYYALRGWDIDTGIPTRETLEKASLGDVADNLEQRGILPRKPYSS
ncbi:aldehyde ferredoxin oxidoreductase C-terminal domain-containing protein [Chloroflexota bacterium]